MRFASSNMIWGALLLLLLLECAQAQLCGDRACITAVACSVQDNYTRWTMMNQTVDGLVATNIVLRDAHPLTQGSNINCPGKDHGCHLWSTGFTDRNGVMYVDGAVDSFVVRSWPVTNGSLPIGPGQTPDALCLAAENVADEGSAEPRAGSVLIMAPCDSALHMALDATTGQIAILSSAPVATPLCVGAPPPPPPPPPHRPNHFYSCTAGLNGGARLAHPFCNVSLDEASRLDDLVGRLSCEEKAAMLTSGGAAVPRLGVPALGSAEDTHGVGGGCIPAANRPANSSSTGCPTTFPAGPGLGASFDRTLWRDVGAQIGLEARGLNNERVSPLYFLDPDINLLRDPRWGRAQEVPGECPFLTGEYGVQVVLGTQEGPVGRPADPRYLLAASTMKHVWVYDYEGYQPNHDSTDIPAGVRCDDPTHCGRGTFDANYTQRDLAGYFLGAFRATAQRAAPAAIMCAYNALYGIPACASPLTNTLARQMWGWDGFVISDCGAVAMIQGSHHYAHNDSATVAAALNQGGVDVNCGLSPPFYTRHMCAAVADGAISTSDIDRAARRYLRTMMRLGMFDPMEDQPLVTSIGAADVDSASSRALAKRAAAESLVLLKNDGVLPMDGTAGRLSASGTKFAFIGPHANATQDLLSAPQYHGSNTLVNSHSPLLVAQRRGWDVSYAKGVNICDWVPAGYPNQPCSRGPPNHQGPLPAPDVSGIPAAVAAAQAADVAVLFLGADQTTEAENFDRVSLSLAGAQEHLLEAVAAVCDKVVLVLVHGGPIAIESAKASASVRAIVDVFQPGELGADAIADAIDGTAAPSGLLPYTVYLANYTQRDIREVDLRGGPAGTTYWWHTDPVLWPFGFGLSYTNFTYTYSHMGSQQAQPAELEVALPDAADAVAVAAFSVPHKVVVTNTGTRTSDVIVTAFVVADSAGGSPADTPLRRLFGFERFAAVRPGDRRTAFFESGATALGVVGADGARRLLPGKYRLEFGGTGGAVAGGVAPVATAEVHLTGNVVLVEPSLSLNVSIF